MFNDASIWDKPVTNAQLDSFYGREVPPYKVSESIGRFRNSIDARDLADVLFDKANEVIDAVWESDEMEVGRIVTLAMKQYVADLASRECYGRVGVVKASEV